MMFVPIFDGDSLQDGFVDLTTANFDRLHSDVVEDLTLMARGGVCEGKEKKLNFEQFVKLMLAAEVPSIPDYFPIIIYERYLL
jgi:hypothetical protein